MAVTVAVGEHIAESFASTNNKIGLRNGLIGRFVGKLETFGIDRNKLIVYAAKENIDNIVEWVSGNISSGDLQDCGLKFNGLLRRLLGEATNLGVVFLEDRFGGVGDEEVLYCL